MKWTLLGIAAWCLISLPVAWIVGHWLHNLEARLHDEDERPIPCTCTIACIPQGITEEQTCRLQLESEDRHA